MTTAIELTSTAVLDRMQASAASRKWTNRELAKELGVSTTTSQLALNRLVQIAAVEFVVIGQERRFSLASDAVAPVVDSGIVPGFRPDMWKPEMRGYASRLAAHASLAMLSRR